MKHYIDRVVLSFFSCLLAGILVKYLYSIWLHALYAKQLEAISKGIILLN